MRTSKYHIYLSDTEYSHIVKALIQSKNALIKQGRYTDAVDELIYKVTSAKKEKLRVKYI